MEYIGISASRPWLILVLGLPIALSVPVTIFLLLLLLQRGSAVDVVRVRE